MDATIVVSGAGCAGSDAPQGVRQRRQAGRNHHGYRSEPETPHETDEPRTPGAREADDHPGALAAGRLFAFSAFSCGKNPRRSPGGARRTGASLPRDRRDAAQPEGCGHIASSVHLLRSASDPFRTLRSGQTPPGKTFRGCPNSAQITPRKLVVPPPEAYIVNVGITLTC